MNKYESTVIMNPSLDDQSIKNLVKKFEDLINNMGKVDDINVIGKRRLAYEIRKSKEGVYVVYKFHAKPDTIVELERNFRITDDIFKFITIREDEE